MCGQLVPHQLVDTRAGNAPPRSRRVASDRVTSRPERESLHAADDRSLSQSHEGTKGSWIIFVPLSLRVKPFFPASSPKPGVAHRGHGSLCRLLGVTAGKRQSRSFTNSGIALSDRWYQLATFHIELLRPHEWIDLQLS